MVVQLEEDSRQLQTEIQTLRRQHLGILAGIPTKTNHWNATAEYYRLFHRGLQADSLLKNVQLEFVRATMAADVVFNTEYGTEALVKNWCFLQWFEDVAVELERLERSSKTSVVATVRTSVTITDRTSASVFPHLLTPKEDNNLASKLLGQRISMHGSARFDWGSSIYRVTSVVSQSDMYLLGSIEKVSKVFDQAPSSSGDRCTVV